MDRTVQQHVCERYIDRYKYIEGKLELEGDVKYAIASTDMTQEFIDILKISPFYAYYLGLTENASQFFKSFKGIEEVFPIEYWEDLFYTAKLGKRYRGVPSKLFYILNKAVSTYKYPNLAMSAIPEKLLTDFYHKSVMGDVTILDVLSNICKSEVKLLSPYRRRAQFGDCVEVYVQSDVDGNLIDRVALISIEISKSLSDKEVTNIKFDSKIGLVSDDLVIRTMAGHVGITFYDYDLREVL